MDDYTYSSSLAEFVAKSIRKWAAHKKQSLEPKLMRNYQAVTNQEFRDRVWKKEEGEGWRSTTWVGFVRVKIWAFYSMMLDTCLRAGKIPFVLEPSHYEERSDEDYYRERDKRIEKMTDKIHDQLRMRHADREYMKKWLSGGWYGMAFSKFDVDAVEWTEFKQVDIGIGNAAQYMTPEESSQYVRYEMVQMSENTPGHRYVSVWNMVWDMDGDDLQSCDGYAEFIASSAYDLKQLSGPGYIKESIERVIRDKRGDDLRDGDSDGPSEHPSKASIQERKKKFRRYEFYMRAPARFVDEFERDLRTGNLDIPYLGSIDDSEEAEESGDEVEIMGEICENEIIRYIRNVSGKRNHKMWVVEQNLDESTGTGISDNMEDVQASLVGMIRAFEDNKKLSANVTSAVKRRYFNDPSQANEIKPGHQYDIADSCDDVRKAIMPITFPDVGESLVTGIDLMLKLKDDVSMIPTIMQGFTLQKHQPDTAYEMRQLTENAGKYIGQAIRNNDEMFIEPEIRDIYEYNMLYGDEEDCKVNCKVKANGFTSFQNKEIRGERMKLLIGGLTANEILVPHIKIKPHLELIYESMDEDPEKFLKSEEEMVQESQQRQQEQERMLAIAQAEKENEARLKMAEAAQKHQHGKDLEAQKAAAKSSQIEQEHINAMEMALVEDRLEEDKPAMEASGGSK